MTAFDDYIDLTDQIDTLRTLNINTATELADETALIRKVKRLNLALDEYRETTTTNYNSHAAALAASDSTTAELIMQANLSAHETRPDHYERVVEILQGAVTFAEGNAARRFKRRGDSLLEVIRPKFDELAQRVLNAVEVLPQGTFDLDDATRLGHAATYLQLEQDISTWQRIAALIQTWRKKRLLSGSREYVTVEFMVQDSTAYSKTSASSGRILRIAAGIAAGHPDLHIPSGTPGERIEGDDARRRAYAADREDQTARKALPLPR